MGNLSVKQEVRLMGSSRSSRASVPTPDTGTSLGYHSRSTLEEKTEELKVLDGRKPKSPADVKAPGMEPGVLLQ